MRQLTINNQITGRELTSLGKYLNEVSRIKLIRPDEEADLSRKIRSGDQKALEFLVRSNLRFVISVAKHYQGRGLPLPDLINEGNLGLIKAAERFDETKGFKFISYAVWWVRQSILQALAEYARIVKLPINKIGSYSKMLQAFTQLEQDYQREPTMDEVAEMMNMHPATVEMTLNASGFQVSIDAPLIEDDGTEKEMYDQLLTNDTPSPDESLIDESLKADIEMILDYLNNREAEIIRYYFGLKGYRAQSLDEISKKWNISRERVRQIKENALMKLQLTSRNNILKSYNGS